MATSLPDITEVPELTAADHGFLEEMAALFSARGMDKLFGISVVHGHDGMTTDDVLVERVTPKGIRVRVEPRATAQGRPTVWRFENERAVPLQLCTDNGGNYHDVGRKASPL